MSNAHTPGPWRSHDHQDKRHREYAIMAAEGDDAIKVASCHAHHVDWTTAEANARLIASAPDLLAALRAAVLHAPIPHDGIDAQWVADAESAIAKATDPADPLPSASEALSEVRRWISKRCGITEDTEPLLDFIDAVLAKSETE